MTPLLDRKAQRNQKERGASLLVHGPEYADFLLREGFDHYASDTLDKWSEKDDRAFRMFSLLRGVPPITQIAIDFSYSKPTIAWLKASGYKHVIGYVSQRADKNITRAFCEDCLAAGITITFVSQDGSQDPLAGYDRGRLRAEQADTMLDRIGYPTWCPVFYAVDFDASPGQLAGPVKDWLRGIKEVSALTGRQYGPYGSFRTIETLSARWYWQCVAWSGGKVSAKAHMLQYPGRKFYFPPGYSSYDENHLRLAFPKWGDKPPVIKPEEPVVQRWGRYAVPMVGAFWGPDDA